LAGEEHPPTWTHAFTDYFDRNEKNDDDQRLMIAGNYYSKFQNIQKN
jgi:hypothetical protein